MSWSPGELWFDADLSWFGQRAPAIALTPPLPFPVPPGWPRRAGGARPGSSAGTSAGHGPPRSRFHPQ